MKFTIKDTFYFVGVKEVGKSNMYVLLDADKNKINTFGVDPEENFEEFQKVDVVINVNLKKTKTGIKNGKDNYEDVARLYLTSIKKVAE
ncbi:hypothetical protein [Bacillus cereus]|uniref:Uncharacterized protein n=1 Tax=Bacillus cereus TaxID=1396 RepID=A0A161T977_BACCE|nr:hypothetical protein [Bacillus cereus]KZD71081.1 hypothetical protein B4088_0978 [Bacillus cereus]HDR7795978.1 hypothetical protein [Bacillus luti]